MAIFEAMARLALEPLRRTKCSSTLAVLEGLPAAPVDEPDPADPRLQAALSKAGEQAWLVLEVLLAGPAFWRACHLYLADSAWQELSQHVQFLREKLQGRASSPLAEE